MIYIVNGIVLLFEIYIVAFHLHKAYSTFTRFLSLFSLGMGAEEALTTSMHE
ncbi:conserved hypothetical protein [Bacillus pseudomycoides]|nr:hypothetical protein bmyco0002_39130 [Bacillus pseudomycoides]EEM09369.1 hypothetical protein bmyco0003_40120 [Bacillus pseudomycoides]